VEHAQNKEWRVKEDRCKLKVSFVSTRKSTSGVGGRIILK
jgi:hypothetical protein